MIQQSTAATLQGGLQSYVKNTTSGVASTSRTKSNSQEQAGPSSQASPDVTTSFSAASLEASRALSQPTEVAAQDRTEERQGESELRESSVKQQQEMMTQTEQQQSRPIDIMA